MPSVISSRRHCIWPLRRSRPGRIGGAPVASAGQLAAIQGEAPVFLGQKNSSGSPQYPFLQTNAGQEHFLDVSGWNSDDTRVNLDKMASLYAPGQVLHDSQFWYHAEFFDLFRLRRLFTNAVDTGGSAIDFMSLLDSTPGNPAVLNNPALICYYLFYPAHEESLSGCVDPLSGQPIPTAKDFASFAGEWSCIALLLDRPNAASSYAPKWVGLTNRNLGKTSVNDQEVRTTMRLMTWSALTLYEGTHPQLNVGLGSHGLYIPGERPQTLSFDDPSAAFCGAGSPLSQPVGDTNASLAFDALYLKFFAGAGEGEALFGPPGGLLGAIGGMIWGVAEFNSLILRQPEGPVPELAPTTDTVGANGLVIYPKGLRPAGADPNLAMEWQSDDNVAIAGRQYFFTVDRATQVLWGDDPDGQGYTGRWGADVVQDPQHRRSGMAFPKFWQIFFEALVRNDLPARTIVLNRDATSPWTVPNDWNNANNSIECIGGGGGGGGGANFRAAGGGGGGEYGKVTNVTLTPGAPIAFSVGAGGAGGPAGSNGGSGGDTSFNGATVTAKGGGGGASTGSGGGGGAGGSSVFNHPGGNGGSAAGGQSTNGGAGGGGAGGPNGKGGAGGSNPGNNGSGAGGGGGGGGSDGESTTGLAAPNPGANGGNNFGGNGAGLGGSSDPGAPTAGTNGGGGGGGPLVTPGSSFGGGDGGASNDIDGANGSGGGGGGAGSNQQTLAYPGGAGGNFGGGGGGGSEAGGAVAGAGGKGADGIIVIRYTP